MPELRSAKAINMTVFVRVEIVLGVASSLPCCRASQTCWGRETNWTMGHYCLGIVQLCLDVELERDSSSGIIKSDSDSASRYIEIRTNNPLMNGTAPSRVEIDSSSQIY